MRVGPRGAASAADWQFISHGLRAEPSARRRAARKVSLGQP